MQNKTLKNSKMQVEIDKFVQQLNDNSEAKIFVNSYSGLGDALIHGPYLMLLSRLYPNRIVYQSNPVISLYNDLKIEHLLSLIHI